MPRCSHAIWSQEMAVKRLVFYPQGEARLRRRSKPVNNLRAKNLRRLIQDLKDTLETQPGAAIAAAQIGVPKRVTVVKLGQDENDEEEPMLALINPEITAAGKDEVGFDGCLSIPDIFTWDVPRPAWLQFRALGEDGKEIVRRVRGMDARVIHHEIDHFNGVLFLDRLRDPTELYTPAQDENGEMTMLKLSDLPGVG